MICLPRLSAGLALAFLALGVPAKADRWFGSVEVHCDSFAYCIVSPSMPEPPGDPATLRLERSGKADAPLRLIIWVNKPVEGGVPVRLDFGTKVFDLQPGTDVLMERHKSGATESTPGYVIAAERAAEVIAEMRKVDVARLTMDASSKPQERVVMLDGLADALRWVEHRQDRNTAIVSAIERRAGQLADAPVPRHLPQRAAWPKEIERIFKREKCADRLATFDELTEGFIAAPAPGRELWAIPCDGGNYNIVYVLIDVRNADPTTARLMRLPVRSRKDSLGVAINPTWWDARKELWAFERGRSHGDCGVFAQYRWTPSGFTLVNERRKDDCDGRFDDPWTKWPETKVKAGRRK